MNQRLLLLFCATALACGAPPEAPPLASAGPIAARPQTLTLDDLKIGPWQLQSLYNSECLQARDSPGSVGSWMVNRRCQPIAQQELFFEDPDGDGWFRIRTQSGLYLTVPHELLYNETMERVRLTQESGVGVPLDHPNRLFAPYRISQDTFQLLTKTNHLVSMGRFRWASTQEDDFLTQYVDNYAGWTTFRIQRAGGAQDLRQGYWQIHTTQDGERKRECVQAIDGSFAHGAHIVDWSCDPDALAQQIKFEDEGNNTWRLRFRHSNMYMDVAYNSSSERERLIQWFGNTTGAQRFRLEPVPNTGGTHIRTSNNLLLAMSYFNTIDPRTADRYLTQLENPYEASRFHFSRADVEDPTDYGYADRRWMVDYNGDGKMDFCRAVGSSSGSGSYLGCSLSVVDGSPSTVDVHIPIADWGYADRRWMVDFNGDGKVDFCRAVGSSSGSGSYLGCSLSTPGAPFAGPLNMWAPIADWGYVDRRYMADYNGDGKADFCRAVGSSSGSGSYLGCSLSTGAGLQAPISLWVPIADWGYADRRWMVDFNGDGKADFCRAVGSSSGSGSSLGCSLSTPGAPFAGPLNMWAGMADWGAADRRFFGDINGDHKADLCVGIGSYGVYSKLRCLPSTGGGAGAMVQVDLPNYGTQPSLRFLADINGDGRAEYVRKSYWHGSIWETTAIPVQP